MPKKILIIEDEQVLLKNLEGALHDDFVITSSITGHDGLRIAQQESFNLILLDVMLPDGDGIEILKVLKTDERTKNIPVLVISNLDGSAVLNRIIEAGGKEYLSKADSSLDEMVKKVRKLAK